MVLPHKMELLSLAWVDSILVSLDGKALELSLSELLAKLANELSLPHIHGIL